MRNEETLPGRFLSPNCHGEEKVKRLLKVKPDRKDYYLYAYGDSKGDIPLLELADEEKCNSLKFQHYEKIHHYRNPTPLLEVYTLDAVKVGEARFANGQATVKVSRTPATYYI